MRPKNWQHKLTASRKILSQAGVESAAGDARWLLAHALEISPDRLALVLRDDIGPAPLARFDQYIQRRCRHEPVSHILGAREFYGRKFKVNSEVLDPRPETELLVDLALENTPAHVLDLGTGSGCILLSILSETPSATGVGCDMSSTALKVAAGNAKRLGLIERAEFLLSDWFSNICGQFDLIVANPPYVSAAEYTALAPDVAEYEPRIALTTGGDGLEAYRVIAGDVAKYLSAGGRLIVEIGPTQGPAVSRILATTGLAEIEIRDDLDGRNRVVIGRQTTDNTT